MLAGRDRAVVDHAGGLASQREDHRCRWAAVGVEAVDARGGRPAGAVGDADGFMGERIDLQSVAIGGNQWQSVASHGQSVAIGGNPWQSVAIGGNRWQSVAIGGNQWQSVAIDLKMGRGRAA